MWLVMSNHYHLALKLSPEQLEDLSDEDVMERWLVDHIRLLRYLSAINAWGYAVISSQYRPVNIT